MEGVPIEPVPGSPASCEEYSFNNVGDNTRSATSAYATCEIIMSNAYTYTFTMCPVNTGTSVFLDPFVRLFDPAGAEVVANDDASTDACPGTPLAPGFTYTIPQCPTDALPAVTATYSLHQGCYWFLRCTGKVLVTAALRTDCPSPAPIAPGTVFLCNAYSANGQSTSEATINIQSCRVQLFDGYTYTFSMCGYGGWALKGEFNTLRLFDATEQTQLAYSRAFDSGSPTCQVATSSFRVAGVSFASPACSTPGGVDNGYKTYVLHHGCSGGSSTCAGQVAVFVSGGSGSVCPTASPSDSTSVTSSETPSVTASDSQTVTPSDTSSVTPSESQTATPTDSPSVTPSVSPSMTASDSMTASPSSTPQCVSGWYPITPPPTSACAIEHSSGITVKLCALGSQHASALDLYAAITPADIDAVREMIVSTLSTRGMDASLYTIVFVSVDVTEGCALVVSSGRRMQSSTAPPLYTTVFHFIVLSTSTIALQVRRYRVHIVIAFITGCSSE